MDKPITELEFEQIETVDSNSMVSSAINRLIQDIDHPIPVVQYGYNTLL